MEWLSALFGDTIEPPKVEEPEEPKPKTEGSTVTRQQEKICLYIKEIQLSRRECIQLPLYLSLLVGALYACPAAMSTIVVVGFICITARTTITTVTGIIVMKINILNVFAFGLNECWSSR